MLTKTPVTNSASADLNFEPMDDEETPAPITVEITTKKNRKPGLPYIILDRNVIVTNMDDATRAVSTLVKNLPLPAKYKNHMTATFARGSLSGQVRSLFKDFKKFGLAVQPKIRDFMERTPNYVQYSQFLDWMDSGLTPTDAPTMTRNARVNMDFFKFYFLHSISGILS